MTITWLGHACFLLEQDGYRVILDPYTGVPGYPKLDEQAHQIYCSHDHFDHHETAAVRLLPHVDSPFTVDEIATFHDEQSGALRGKNTVRVFSAGGVRVCHLGDLGHPLTGEQIRAIGKCDVVLTPVGGVYTIDAIKAKAVCDALRPRFVVPMHYRHTPYGLETVAGLDKFLKLWPHDAVKTLSGNAFSVSFDDRSEAWENLSVLVPAFPF